MERIYEFIKHPHHGVLFILKGVDSLHPKVLDLNNNLIAILDKAYKIGDTKIKNNLWNWQFTMPPNDRNNKYINPKFHLDFNDHDRRFGRF